MSDGKIISCYSKIHKVGVTSITLLTALNLAETFLDKKVLILDFNNRFLDIEKILEASSSDSSNIYDLLLSHKITKEDVVKCVVKVKSFSNLYLINGSYNYSFTPVFSETNLNDLLSVVKEMFDLIVIDTTSNTSTTTCSIINSAADICLNVLVQNSNQLITILEHGELADINAEKVINIINFFDEKKGISLSELEKFYKLENLYSLKQENALTYAMNTHNMQDFLSYSPEKKFFLDEFEEIFEDLCEKIGVELEEEIKPKGFFKNLFNKKKVSI